MVKNSRKLTNGENIALKFTKFIGTPYSALIHTIFFIGIFSLKFLGVNLGDILLILTTVVSLEAIYLAIFIQMSINRAAETLEEVEDEIEDIQEDVEDIQEDVEDISEDLEDISKTRKGLA